MERVLVLSESSLVGDAMKFLGYLKDNLIRNIGFYNNTNLQQRISNPNKVIFFKVGEYVIVLDDNSYKIISFVTDIYFEGNVILGHQIKDGNKIVLKQRGNGEKVYEIKEGMDYIFIKYSDLSWRDLAENTTLCQNGMTKSQFISELLSKGIL